MFEKPQFNIETIETGLNYARYRIEPLEPGYGTTLGNALRRILLRSLDGVAISRIRIDTVWHEFSTIPDVREDVTEIVLNLKRVRLKRIMDLTGEVRAHLYAQGNESGERIVTAGDVEWPAEVDVINVDQPIATLDSANATLDMDIWIEQDRGYRPAEAQETFSLGEIPIDAIFTPIQKVNFVVEHTRVGQMTDFDRLILEILTDGTIEPDDALSQAARILVDYAQVFADLNRHERETTIGTSPFIPEEVQNKQLDELGLQSRVVNALKSRGITKVGQVLTIDPEQLLSIRNFGPRSLGELREKLGEHGYLPEGSAAIGAAGDEGADFESDADGDENIRQTEEAIASYRGQDRTAEATGGEE